MGNVTTAEFLSDMTTISVSITDWVVNISQVFMHPPFNVFLGLGIFGTVVYMVKGMIRG